jgi:hypothetical protein
VLPQSAASQEGAEAVAPLPHQWGATPRWEHRVLRRPGPPYLHCLGVNAGAAVDTPTPCRRPPVLPPAAIREDPWTPMPRRRRQELHILADPLPRRSRGCPPPARRPARESKILSLPKNGKLARPFSTSPVTCSMFCL